MQGSYTGKSGLCAELAAAPLVENAWLGFLFCSKITQKPTTSEPRDLQYLCELIWSHIYYRSAGNCVYSAALNHRMPDLNKDAQGFGTTLIPLTRCQRDRRCSYQHSSAPFLDLNSTCKGVLRHTARKVPYSPVPPPRLRMSERIACSNLT